MTYKIIDYFIMDKIRTILDDKPEYSIFKTTVNKNYAYESNNIVYIYKYLHEINEYSLYEEVRLQINIIGLDFKLVENVSYYIYDKIGMIQFDYDDVDKNNLSYHILKIHAINKPIYIDLLDNGKHLFNFNMYVMNRLDKSFFDSTYN